MNKKIIALCIVFLLQIIGVSALTYYQLELEYDDEEFREISVDVVFSDAEEVDNLLGGYVAELRSFNNGTLEVIYFGVPLTTLVDFINPETGDIDGGYVETVDQTTITLQLPHHENAKDIVIYSEWIIPKLTIDVSQFSKQPQQQTTPTETIPIKPQVVNTEDSSLFFLGISALLLIILLIVLTKRK